MSRRAAYVAIQAVLTGEVAVDAIGACADSLASTVGFAARDLAAADAMIDDLAADMKRTIRSNWDYLRKMRKTMKTAATPGDIQ
jgi:hypothetical protein